MTFFHPGWHNYHHTFPWDYKTAELGNYELNFTSAFIDFFAWLGLAYDLKTVSPKVVEDRIKRTGDGSHVRWHDHDHHHEKEEVEGAWGWGDKDISPENLSVTETLYPMKEE